MATHSVQKTFIDGLTFDDVLLVPAYSEILPRDVDIKTRLTKDITLNVPMLSFNSLGDIFFHVGFRVLEVAVAAADRHST